MMDKLQKVLMLLLLAVISFGLSGCGGEDAFSGGDDPDPGTPGAADVASVLLLTSSPSMGTSSTSEVSLTAQVKDSNNNLLEGESVIFTANGGALVVDSATTNASGIASARLSPTGDPSNRAITVSALAGTVSGSVTVTASGTAISISGENSVVLNDTAVLTISLGDSKGAGIPGELLTVTSANGNPISATSLSTDSSGNVSVTLTGSVAGTDTISVSALGGTANQTHTVNVSGDEFTVTLPAADLAIGSPHTVTATWKINNVAVADGTTINFSSTRGTLSAPSDTTVAGVATVTVSSTTAGPVSVTASSSGPTASVSGEFVATTPKTLNVQAEADVMGPDGQQNTITAVVRDVAGNLVKNIPIRFTIVQDTSGGSISNATAVTDSLGRATTVYTSTAATTAKDGLVIRAEVEGTVDPLLIDSVAITVGKSELFVRLGTGNKIVILDETRYVKTFNVLVTDAGGSAVENTAVTVTLVPKWYWKGERVSLEVDATDPLNPIDSGPMVVNYPWEAVSGEPLATRCQNEDELLPGGELNGVIDTIDLGGGMFATEDVNGSGKLEPGNVASVPGTVTTDATGFALINITYAKDFASWTEVELKVSAQVAGSEGGDDAIFILPVAAADITDPTTESAGESSPFGVVGDCANAN